MPRTGPSWEMSSYLSPTEALRRPERDQSQQAIGLSSRCEAMRLPMSGVCQLPATL
ncbi:hypothetical protein RB8257 [Rhodopirellula baltica SH 1]|uniref:Uncharacterized protein n=1 Tax=Rhodopirellula baltica (strain DSM 10527 / NCIMB 13988 / SH1) TaxID=243090 RepID=Q7UFY4_RHOBA|nr:hypothetical protein RB8257 [Rhodopirellula baltica SH 1]